MSRTKGGPNTQLHLSVDGHGMPLSAMIMQGTVADCTKAAALLEGFTAEYLLADCAYATNGVIAQCKDQKMQVVIPPKQSRKEVRCYAKAAYKLRHLLENTLLYLKGWRGIATRYAKQASSFLAAIQIRCIALWASFL